MTQQHGRRYEHTLSGEIAKATTKDAWVTTAGYSGNAAIDACDIVITLNPAVTARGGPLQYNIEAKKRQAETGKRCSNVFAGGENDETGVEELVRFIEHTPSWATPIIVLSFDHRAPVVMDARLLVTWLCEEADATHKRFGPIKVIRPSPKQERLLKALAPRVTPSGNISMVKPETDRLDSAQVSPPEGEVVADSLRLPMPDPDPFGDVSEETVADD